MAHKRYAKKLSGTKAMVKKSVMKPRGKTTVKTTVKKRTKY